MTVSSGNRWEQSHRGLAFRPDYQSVIFLSSLSACTGLALAVDNLAFWEHWTWLLEEGMVARCRVGFAGTEVVVVVRRLTRWGF